MATEPAPYAAVLEELAVLYADLRRLETRILQLMQACGITDEAIGEVVGISSQAVGQKRRRVSPPGPPPPD